MNDWIQGLEVWGVFEINQQRNPRRSKYLESSFSSSDLATYFLMKDLESNRNMQRSCKFHLIKKNGCSTEIDIKMAPSLTFLR